MAADYSGPTVWRGPAPPGAVGGGLEAEPIGPRTSATSSLPVRLAGEKGPSRRVPLGGNRPWWL